MRFVVLTISEALVPEFLISCREELGPGTALSNKGPNLISAVPPSLFLCWARRVQKERMEDRAVEHVLCCLVTETRWR